MGLINKEWIDAYHEYLIQALTGKQGSLISGVNIKTINGQSILGGGNIGLSSFVSAQSLPEPTENCLGNIYLVPSSEPGADNIKEEWIVIKKFQITYNGTVYQLDNKGEANGFSTGQETEPGVYLHPSEDLMKSVWNDVETEDDIVEIITDDSHYAIGGKIGDYYYYDGHFNVCTPNGWQSYSTLPFIYAWEHIGSTAVNLDGAYTKAQIDAMLNGLKLKVEGTKLIITKNNEEWFTQLTKLEKPATPTISTTTASVVTGSANFTATCVTSGVTIYYSLDNGVNWYAGSSISVASGFSNNQNNTAKTQTIKLKATKNGKTSDIGTVTVTISPKVASGRIVITRNNNNNDYSTSATIVLSPSPTKNATSKYTSDGGSTWTSFDEPITFTTTTSQSANKYQVKATKANYDDADITYSKAFTLNSKKFYYGMGAGTLANKDAITGLSGGGSEETDSMSGTYNIVVDNQNKDKYIWFCGEGTLTKVTSDGYDVPMQSVVTVAGYNCYRSSSLVRETGTYKFTI